MAMVAAYAAHRCRDECGRVLKLARQSDHLTASAKEHGTNGAPEPRLFVPKIHLQTASASVKNNRAFKPRSAAVRCRRQAVPSNQQVVGPLYAQHLYSHKHGRYDGRVHTIGLGAPPVPNRDVIEAKTISRSWSRTRASTSAGQLVQKR
jgi:hypothetical protein